MFLLFWGFFLEIIIFALVVAALGWVITWAIFKATGRKMGEEEKYLK